MSYPALIHPYTFPTRTEFVNIVSGEGATVTDSTGQTYIDGLASLWYVQAGHGNQVILDAIDRQMRTLTTFHTFDKFTNPAVDELAEKLVGLAPFDNARVFLGNSGSEAVETAMKLARISHVRAGRPDRTLVISRDRGYHGVNYGGTTAQGLPLNKEGFGPLLPDVEQVPADDLEALASMMAEHGERIAAVLVEPVQGAGGVFPPPDGYLEGLRRLCDQHGAYLIFDEVITGFGRLGTWLAADFFKVTPDMITFAKGVSSGYLPVSGVMLSTKVTEPLENDDAWMLRHGYTYSGHPTTAAAAVANLDVLADGVIDNGAKMGARLAEGLKSLAADGTIADVRGVGAVYAAKLNDGQDAVRVRDLMMERGVIIRPLGDAVAFCPPLVINGAQVDQMVDALAHAANNY